MMIIVMVVVALVVAVALGAWALVMFNKLVGARNEVEDSWAGIDIQLRKRTDLVPQLVTVVDAYRLHERDTLVAVSGARSSMVAATGPKRLGDADTALESSLTKLYAVAEGYPELRADAQFGELMAQLGVVEDDIAAARRFYNALARRYNDTQTTFPGVLVAGALGHSPAEYFQIEVDASQPSNTKFD